METKNPKSGADCAFKKRNETLKVGQPSHYLHPNIFGEVRNIYLVDALSARKGKPAFHAFPAFLTP